MRKERNTRSQLNTRRSSTFRAFLRHARQKRQHRWYVFFLFWNDTRKPQGSTLFSFSFIIIKYHRVAECIYRRKKEKKRKKKRYLSKSPLHGTPAIITAKYTERKDESEREREREKKTNPTGKKRRKTGHSFSSSSRDYIARLLEIRLCPPCGGSSPRGR